MNVCTFLDGPNVVVFFPLRQPVCQVSNGILIRKTQTVSWREPSKASYLIVADHIEENYFHHYGCANTVTTTVIFHCYFIYN